MVKILVYTSWCTQNVRSKYLCIHHDIHRMRCQKYLWNNMMFTDCVVNISVCTSWCTQNVWSKWLCICHDVHRICGQNTCVCIMRFTNILSKYLCIPNSSHRICGQNTCVYVMMSTECVVRVPVSDVHRMCGQIPVYTMWYSQNVLSKYLCFQCDVHRICCQSVFVLLSLTLWCTQSVQWKYLFLVEFWVMLCTDCVVKELVDKKVVMETLVPEMLAKSDSAELQLYGLNIFSLAGLSYFWLSWYQA